MKKIFLSILFAGLLATLLSCGCYAKNVKFAQVTDAHFIKYSDNLWKIIRDINRTPDIDFVVFTGNNIGRADEQNLKTFMSVVKKLNKRYYIVLGNKDVSKTKKLEKTTYYKIVRKYNHSHPKNPNYVFKKNDIVFIVVDGSKELISTPNGYYSKETITWLDKQLTKYNDKKVVIIQHFPLVNKTTNELVATYNVIEYMQMLSNHNNVLAVVTGHFNKNDELNYNGVYHITTPKASNGYYKIIDIDVDNDYSVYTILKDLK